MIIIRFNSIKVLIDKAEIALKSQDYDTFLKLLAEVSFESNWLHKQLQIPLQKKPETINKLIDIF